MHELKVRPDDLQFTTEKSSGVDTLGKFQFGDIVQIDNQNVGVIVRLERDAFQILTQQVGQCVLASKLQEVIFFIVLIHSILIFNLKILNLDFERSDVESDYSATCVLFLTARMAHINDLR